MKGRMFGLAILVVGLLAFTGMSETSANKTPGKLGGEIQLEQAFGATFDGVWWVTIVPGRPMILTLNRSGTFLLEDSLDWGGFGTNRFSETQGVWERSGAHSMRALGLRFVVWPDGTILAAERVRLEMSLTDDFQQLEGQLTFAGLPCETLETPPGVPFPTFPSCPDVTSELPAFAIGPLPFSAVRLSFDAPNP